MILTSPVDLHVLLQGAVLVEAPAADLAAVRLLARVDPLVPLQVGRVVEGLAAERAGEALLEHQPLHRFPPHRAVAVAVLEVAVVLLLLGIVMSICRKMEVFKKGCTKPSLINLLKLVGPSFLQKTTKNMNVLFDW